MQLDKPILIVSTIFLLIVNRVQAQTECANYFIETNLPSQCDKSTLTCSFQSFANSSLVQNNTVGNQTFISCLNISNYHVSFSSGADILAASIYINALTINLTSYSLTTTQDAIFIASKLINFSSTNISAHLTWAQAFGQVLITNSILKLQDLFETSCNCLTKGSSCTITPYYFPFLYNSIQQPSIFSMSLMNYTYNTWNIFGNNVNSIVIAANDSINIIESTLRISVIAIYSTLITTLNSTINTTGLGFPSGTGYGCGYFDQGLNQLLGCSGTGGSYGGYGGNSSPEGCSLLFSNPPYSRQLIPKYPGSGGGFFLKEVTEVSSGGGVINIQGEFITINSTSVLANGVGGIQGGGGGAGGSISIDYTQFSAAENSVMTANGGNGKSSGSGGRIRIWDQNWKFYQTPNNQNISIEVTGGLQCDSSLNCGENGSIISSPCPPGYSTNFINFMCQICPPGSYQLAYGYGNCLGCNNKPSNSYYTGASNPNQYNSYTQTCSFDCSDGYNRYNGKQCLTKLNMLLVNVGGADLLISLGIIVASLIIFLIITMIRKISYSDTNSEERNEHIDYYKKRSYFKIEDIPFHEIRIYFEGQNTPQRPWKISENVKNNIRQLYENNQNKLLLFTRLVKQLNDICEYHKGLKIALFTLKILYYPLSIILAEVFRERKAKNIRKAIIAKAKNLQPTTGIKFHVNQFFTVGCLEIFNYSKETLDFYIKSYFPMYFKLQRLLIGGYSIDSTDPLLKAIYSQFQDRSNKELQKFFIQLNQLLRNEDQTVYKYLWKITQIWPVLQCYLWQPPLTNKENQVPSLQHGQSSGILGMDNRYSINKDLDLFLVFSIEGKPQNSILNPINQSNLEESKFQQPKFSKHFYYSVQLPNIYYDQISCIRHKYNLREAMIDFQERKNAFWEIETTISQKYLSWALGSISILSLLLNLFAFFLIVFLLVEFEQKSDTYILLVYFALFPLCQFFMIFLEFNVIVSKVSKAISYSIYFTLFAVIKNIIITIIIIVFAISKGFSDIVLFALFLIWIILLICNIASLILQCMINSRFTKTK